MLGAVSHFRLSLRKCKICTGKETVIPARGSQAQLVVGGGDRLHGWWDEDAGAPASGWAQCHSRKGA